MAIFCAPKIFNQLKVFSFQVYLNVFAICIIDSSLSYSETKCCKSDSYFMNKILKNYKLRNKLNKVKKQFFKGNRN